MASRRIRTQHPERGKHGVNIDLAKYETVRNAVVGLLGSGGEITFADMLAGVVRKLRGKFEGSIAWYATTVKLDLEARKVIERVPGKRPQRLRLRG